LLAKIKATVASKNPEWDVVQTGAATLLVLVKNDLLEKVDYSLFDKSVLQEIEPRVVHSHGIGTIFFSQVIGYNTKHFVKGNHPRTWADVWDVKRFPGPRVLHAGNYEVPPIEYALMADGVPPDKLYPLDFDRAYRSLTKIKPHVAKWSTSGSAGPQALVDGEAYVAAVSHGRIPQLKREGAPVDFEWNQGLLQLDYWAIPKGAKNYKNAIKFIEFASRAKPQAEMVKILPFGPVNRQAFQHLTPEQARELASHPENMQRQVLYNFEWWAETDASGKSNIEKNIELWNSWISR
jgi:putative spermidine/putrescine transport system substrate-binding protein